MRHTNKYARDYSLEFYMQISLMWWFLLKWDKPGFGFFEALILEIP